MTHADTINALRTMGEHELADNLVRVLVDHGHHVDVQRHYESLATEAMGERGMSESRPM
jgi:hypothetical protein